MVQVKVLVKQCSTGSSEKVQRCRCSLVGAGIVQAQVWGRCRLGGVGVCGERCREGLERCR